MACRTMRKHRLTFLCQARGIFLPFLLLIFSPGVFAQFQI